MNHVSEEVLVGQVGPGIPLREALVADGEAVRVEEVAHHEVLVGDLIVADPTQARSLPGGESGQIAYHAELPISPHW